MNATRAQQIPYRPAPPASLNATFQDQLDRAYDAAMETLGQNSPDFDPKVATVLVIGLLLVVVLLCGASICCVCCIYAPCDYCSDACAACVGRSKETTVLDMENSASHDSYELEVATEVDDDAEAPLALARTRAPAACGKMAVAIQNGALNGRASASASTSASRSSSAR